MLLVVAVIVLLIALLLPSLSRARHHTRQVQCGTYHAQVGVSMIGFAVDHFGRFPLNPAHNTGYGPALYQIGSDKRTSLVEQLRPYVSTFQIFTCPMNDQIPPPDHPSNTGATLVWAYWYLANYRNSSGVYTSKVTGMHNRGDWGYYGDIIHSHGGWIGPYASNHLSTAFGYSNPVQTAFPGSPTARWFVVGDTWQIGGSNILTVDGSVTFTALEDLQQVSYGSLFHWYGWQR